MDALIEAAGRFGIAAAEDTSPEVTTERENIAVAVGQAKILQLARAKPAPGIADVMGSVTSMTSDGKGVHLKMDVVWESKADMDRVIDRLPSMVRMRFERLEGDDD